MLVVIVLPVATFCLIIFLVTAVFLTITVFLVANVSLCCSSI
jgi:hypothetical protein